MISPTEFREINDAMHGECIANGFLVLNYLVTDTDREILRFGVRNPWGKEIEMVTTLLPVEGRAQRVAETVRDYIRFYNALEKN